MRSMSIWLWWVSLFLSGCPVDSPDYRPPPFWSERLGDADRQLGHGIAADPADNVIVTGTFRGTIDLGQGPLTATGADDALLAKFDQAGKLKWGRRVGGIGTDFAGGLSVASDSAGDMLIGGELGGTGVITGSFSGALDFGCGDLQAKARGSDVLVTKLDKDGVCLWNIVAPGVPTRCGPVPVCDVAQPAGGAAS